MKPDTEEAVAEAIMSARAPICIEGGATRGCAVAGDTLSVSALTGITLYEPGALTLVAKAGTPLAEINAALAAEGQRLAFEPTDLRALLKTSGTPTIGGVIASNASGPRRIQTGAARDHTLGVRFVDGSGNIVKNGGRVMKNVTGYDLVKLMAGSFGTLGVLTEVSLKVLPVSETQKTLMVNGLDDAAAIRLMAAAMRSPYDVSGAAHGSINGSAEAVTLLRLEGFETSVDYRVDALKAVLGDQAPEIQVVDNNASEKIWLDFRDVQQFSNLEGDIWRVSCRPSDAAALAGKSGARSWSFDWAGGLIWLCTYPDVDLRARLENFDGHATRVRAMPKGMAGISMFSPMAPGVEKLTQGLRSRFDPRGILNQGLMGSPVREAV